MFLHVIARSEATWQSVLLRQYITKSNTLGEYEKHCEFALSTTDMSGISAGKTDCHASVRTGSQ